MIEQVMFFSLGFLIAALLALAVAPAFWHRAIRLSTKRLELQLPLSAREIVAARDLVRAEAALERRKLEQRAEALTRARGQDKAELGRRALIIARQEADLASAAEQAKAQEAELAARQRDLAQASAELGAALSALNDASARCEQKDAKLFDLRCHVTALQVLAHNQRVAFAALEKDLLNEREKLEAEAARSARLSGALASLRLEREEDLARLEEAAGSIARQSEALAAAKAREIELGRQGAELAAKADATERGLRADTDRMRAENAKLLEALDAARERCESLERELTELKGQAPEELQPSRDESEEFEILRQKIAEIGAAVIRMADRGDFPSRPELAREDGETGSHEQEQESCLVFAKAGGGAAAQ